MGARWYDPNLSRFLSEDPSGFDGGDANLYRYVGNSFPNATDPTGESIKPPTFSLPKFNAFDPIGSLTSATSSAFVNTATSYAGNLYSGFTNVASTFSKPFSSVNYASPSFSDPLLQPVSQYVTNSQLNAFNLTPAVNPTLASANRLYATGDFGTRSSSAVTNFVQSIPDPIVAYANSPRAQAVGQLVGSGFEGFASAAFALAPDPTLATKAAAGYLAYRAFDNGQAAIRQLYSGVPTDTLTKVAVSGGLSYVGVNQQLANQVGGGVNFAADIASLGVSLAAPKLKLPTARTNAELVQDIATRAEAKIGGTGRFAGTDKHVYAKKLLDRYQDIFGQRGLQTELSVIGGREVPYGTAGSVRLDVLEGNVANPNAIYDYKFGASGLSNGRINQIQTVTGYGPSVPIIPVHP
jgi:hypothetical protein